MTEPHKWLEKGISNQACFHAQQGVEKALKGFLRSRQRSVPRTHALTELLSIARTVDESFQRLEDSCIKLDQFYIPTRYPDALPGIGSEGLPTLSDAESAVEALRDSLNWIESKMDR